MYKQVGQTKVRTYDVQMGATVGALLDVGYCDEPEVLSKPTLLPVKLGQLGAQKLGSRVIGFDVTVKFKLREITEANLQLALPWGSAQAGWGLAPPTNGVDLYAYAKVIRFRPRDLANDDHTQDITLLKAASIMGLNVKGDGEKDASIDFEFECYPDRASLPTISLGYMGVAVA
jgi:hypothetical protein